MPDKKEQPQEEEGNEKEEEVGEGIEEEGKREEGGEEAKEEEEKEPSALERILPAFPAARRQVFVQVEAVSGLIQPFAARGHILSARVFWNGEEVRTSTSWRFPRG